MPKVETHVLNSPDQRFIEKSRDKLYLNNHVNHSFRELGYRYKGNKKLAISEIRYIQNRILKINIFF